MKNLSARVSHLLLTSILTITGCGSKGDPGAKGNPGADGTNGANGVIGAIGDAGPRGADGTNGINGANGINGDAGKDGDASVSTAPVSLKITNSLTGAAVANATATLAPALATFPKSDANGKIAATSVPIGDYTLSIAATGFTTATQDLELVAGFAEDLTVKLVPTANVVANAGSNVSGQAPGATVTVTGSAIILDNSTGATYSWAQTDGPTASLAGTNTQNLTVTMPPVNAIKAELVKVLQMPVRMGVLGINPHAIEQATSVVLTLTVKTSSGSYTSTPVSISATAPFQVTSGLRNVPVGIPQLLQASGTLADGKTAATNWNWKVTTAPSGSTATLADTTSQYSVFTPDLMGRYVLSEATTGGTLTLYSGKWSSAIGSINVGDGLPDKPDNCALCHTGQGNDPPDVWVQWRQTGHAVIVPENIDTPNNHWTITGCASCHTVGDNPLASANNGGFDDVLALTNWKVPAGAPGVYESMFKNTDPNIQKLAGLMNVQCDNCHGPSNSVGHSAGQTTPLVDQAARIDLSAEVCGQCHGEPPRHGRYQEWQLSLHSNAAVAIARANAAAANDNATTGDNPVNSCGRCHSAEGFVVWQGQSIARGYDFNMLIQGAVNNGNNGNATGAELRAMGMTAASVHPQTCTACHDPHDVGKTSGLPNTANVRVQNDIAMLPSGFPAPGLGAGAICATCHNSRNGAHNDTITSYGASGVSTPHDSTATDVLLGQNMYFVTPGQRGGHSYISDACVNCHMQLTKAPADLSNTPSTNHTFSADLTICTNCHGAFDGGSIQSATRSSLTSLTQYIGSQAAKTLNGIVFWARARRIPASSTDTTAVYSHAAAANSSDLTAYNVKVDLTSGTNSITSATLMEDSSNIDIKLANALQIQWTDGAAPVSVNEFIISLTSIKSDDGTGTTPTTTYPISLTGNLAKGIWNYITLYREGSFGIHNPGFTNLVIGATMSQDLTK